MSLKSTYKPSPGALAPLPLGWTEHKAPTGHTYYYNAETKESTYKRPVAPSMGPVGPSMSFLQHQSVPAVNLSDPAAANAFMAQYTQPQHQSGHRGGFGGRGGFQPRPRPQPVDKPRSKVAIPGQEGWFLVYTKYGRRFAFNATKNASYWRIPEKLKPGILELDQARIRQKAGIDPTPPENDTTVEPKKETESSAVDQKQEEEGEEEEGPHDYDSSEYEEVEVTDSEGEPDEDGNPTKRQRTEDPNDQQNDGPVEFTEEDIAAQLAAMGADYDEVEYNMSEEHEEPVLSDEDARELFKDLLNDYNINPYSPWEKLIEEGKIFDDPRYTVLNTMRSRKEVWEEWSRQKIQELKERRAKQEKKDPRIPYLAFLQEKATPKLYWPEFKRKYKKEDPMKDTKLLDKDREKMYREHINRIKLPQATLKADLKKLLESVPLGLLNNQTMVDHLPPQVLSDLRYISLDRKIRDPLIEGYIQGLPPAPEDGEQQQIDEATQKARDDRRKREKAMQDRERAVAEEKRRQEKKLQFERARLRDEERELERAMQVGKRGLQSQLVKEEGS